MKKVRSKLTYANVISTMCLFMLLGGGAYAATQLPKNSVGTKQLKNGSITPAKLSKTTKKALKGAVGPAGPQGPQGAPGAPGATNVVVRDSGEYEVGTQTARCNAGEVAVGGGGETEEAEQLLWRSRPLVEGGKAVGWQAGGETPTGGEAPAKAYVVCASP
ncbi:MAG: hypothetical protein M3335_06975 [Actinomycetota bacterium]|nr:hypothetical protein [Actinomycetota bacterium]